MAVSTLTDVLSEALTLSDALTGRCTQPDFGVTPAVAMLFVQLSERIEALPPTVADLATMVQLRNRLRSALGYWKAGEAGAARHEAVQLHRKLARLSA